MSRVDKLSAHELLHNKNIGVREKGYIYVKCVGPDKTLGGVSRRMRGLIQAIQNGWQGHEPWGEMKLIMVFSQGVPFLLHQFIAKTGRD